MRFQITLRQALKIQADQIKHYSKFRSDLPEVMASKTNVEGYDLDTPMDVADVNRLVPRGGAIEYVCGLNFSD